MNWYTSLCEIHKTKEARTWRGARTESYYLISSLSDRNSKASPAYSLGQQLTESFRSSYYYVVLLEETLARAYTIVKQHKHNDKQHAEVARKYSLLRKERFLRKSRQNAVELDSF